MSKETDPSKAGSCRQDAQKVPPKSILDFDYRVAWPVVSLFFGLRWKHHQMTGRLAKIKEGDNVLELGAGYPLWRAYSRQVGEGVFVSLDADFFIQKTSKKICFLIDRVFKKEKAREFFLTANAGKLPLESNSFDIVIANSANSLNSSSDYINEAYRVLKPGGRLVASWTEKSDSHQYSEQAAVECESIGFEKIEIREGVVNNWYVLARKPIGLSESGQGD